ncbi:MAG: protein kinase [Deltaproteobacteria bacterium]|nr:protein kinase [Deltaproteobacteria bacterium]
MDAPPRYELLVTIATGGMATVYVGRQHGAAGFERIVAIKRMHQHIAGDPNLIAMFRDEARIASLIRHPNVVAVHDMHDESGELLIIMDYVDGVNLRQLRHACHSAGSLIPRNVALRIVVDTLRGLHAAHTQRDVDGTPLQIVHRDATPHNILVGADGSSRLTDFGIARAAERSAGTMTGRVKGKFAYMSPEQCASRPADHRVDIFSMGVVAWELLTGSHLFQADSDAAMVAQIARGNYRRPSEVRRGIPLGVEEVVMRAIATDPRHRFPTAAQFADELHREALPYGGTATPEEVSAVVMAACGEAVLARRGQLHDVLAGRRPKVTWSTPRSSPPTKGSRSYDVASVPRSRSSQIPLPPATSTAPVAVHATRQPMQRAVWVLAAVFVIVVTLMIAFVIHDRSSSSETAAASSSAPAASARVAPSSSVAAPQRIAISIEAEAEITEVRAPSGGDVDIQGKTAVVNTLKSETAMTILVRLTDGTSHQETVVPRANAVIRVRSTASPSKTAPVVAAVPGTTPVAPPTTGKTSSPVPIATPAATPPPAKTAEPKVGPRHEKDPYQ